MAKIRVAQIKDLSLTGGVITIGTDIITPLTTVLPSAETGKVVNGFEVNGNTIKPLFTEISFANYYTKSEVDSAIGTATTDMATQTWVGEQFDEKLADYVKKEDIATSINTNPVVTKVASEKAVADYVADYVADQLDTLDTTAYTAGNGIDISNHVVSAVVKSGDQVLSVDANGLQTTIGITYDETNKEIKLVGKDGAQIGDAIDATDFIKDGMLKSVVLDGTNLVLTWNTDGDPNGDGATGDVVTIPLGSLVDVYTADETYIKLGEDNKFSHVEKTDVDTNNTYGGNSTATPHLVFSLPKFTVDQAGHIDSITNDIVQIPTATTIVSTTGAGLATEGAVKNYVDNAFTAQATKHVHQEASDTTITLSSTPVNTAKSNFDVYQNGIRLNESEFTVNGATLTIDPEVAHVEGDKYLVCYVAKA